MCGHVGTIACTCLWKQKGGNGCLSSIAFHFIFIFELGSCVCVWGGVVSAVSTEDRGGLQIR